MPAAVIYEGVQLMLLRSPFVIIFRIAKLRLKIANTSKLDSWNQAKVPLRAQTKHLSFKASTFQVFIVGCCQFLSVAFECTLSYWKPSTSSPFGEVVGSYGGMPHNLQLQVCRVWCVKAILSFWATVPCRKVLLFQRLPKLGRMTSSHQQVSKFKQSDHLDLFPGIQSQFNARIW